LFGQNDHVAVDEAINFPREGPFSNTAHLLGKATGGKWAETSLSFEKNRIFNYYRRGRNQKFWQCSTKDDAIQH
jgi:hypothetical protein